MAEYNITANDLERLTRMAYLESGSIPAQDRVRDFQQVLGSMLTRGQLFANGMAGEGYGGLRSDQTGNKGFDNTPIQRSLAAKFAYEPLLKYGNDLSKLPDVPSIYRELAAEYFGNVLKNPDIVDLHTDYGNPIVVKQRQERDGKDWTSHWLYGVSQNPDMINGAGTSNQHAHGTMTGITLPKSFNPGFNGGAQEWINVNQSRDGLKSPEAIQAMLDWAATPDISIGTAGTDGFGDKSNIGDALALGRGGIGANGSVNTGLSTAMGYNAPGSGPGDALGGGPGSFTDGISDPRVAGSIYINPNTFAGRFAVGDALGAGNGSIGNSGRPVETGNPYNFSSLSPGQAVRDAYENVLGRTATQSELDGWKGMIHPGGMTLGQALDQIAASPEAAARATFTGVDPRTYGVIDAYASQLNRLPDQQGLTGWMQQLSQGASLDSVLNRISNSPEAQRADLSNFYQTALKRQADPSGLQYALDQLAGGRSLQAVETSILNSPEAQALGIAPGDFSRYLSADPYGVSTIGPDGYSTPVGPGSTQYPLPAGPTQGTVGPGPTQGTVGGAGTEISPVGPTETRPVGPGGFETNIVGAPEASKTIDDLYETILARDPDTQGSVEYQGQIQRGVPPSIVAAQILNSPEARAIPPEQYQGLVQGYREKYGLMPEEVQTLGPLASEFAQVLRRPADSKTLQAWDQQIDAGSPLSLLEAQLIQAPEVQALGAPALSQLVQNYQNTYALKPEEVTAIGPLASEFARVLDRPADIETIRAWDGQLDSGATLPQLQAQLLQAPEVLGRTGGAGDAYTAFQGQYGRSPVDYLAALSDPTKFSGANVSGNIGNGSFSGFNGAEYLAANRDVAASGMDPLAHFVKYGLGEGRALDTAGHHLSQNFDGTAYLAQNQDVARAGMNPLEHYLMNGAREGRAAPTGANPFSFTGINASAGLGPIGNGTFSGTFNGNSYLAANPDVAASKMDPLEHYLRYGFGEGRAVDAQGDRLPVNFDGAAYLAQNRDVAMAGMDPLRHYLMSGASEGRALPTGSNNYSFSNFNVAGGLGNPGNGSFGLGGITSSAPGGMGTMQTPAPQASNPINPFGFSQMNAGTYAAPNAPLDAPPSGFETSWESASKNALQGSGGASGSAWEYTDPVTGEKKVATFDPQKSENAYLAGQVAQNQQQTEAGRLSVANNPNLWNFGASNLLNSVAASNYQPAPIYSTATAQTAALAPTMPAPFNSPLPVMQQGLRVNPYGGFGLISAF